jgi:hypothetical protein
MGGGAATGGGGGGGAVVDAGTPELRLFITSARYVSHFGSLTVADDLCTAAARGALQGGTWKAWLSDSTTRARSRFTAVGPWVQEFSDGGVVVTFPDFASLHAVPLVGLSATERGLAVGGGVTYWTGTLLSGDAGTTCDDWRAAGSTSSGTIGETGQATPQWTATGTNDCAFGVGALLCFEQSKLPSPPPVGSVQRRVFVTSTPFAPDAGSLSAADAHCTAAAVSANKGGTWKAWLSNRTTAAFARLQHPGPWAQELADGGTLLTFHNAAQLRSIPLASLRVDEQGRELPAGTRYWTGTTTGGLVGFTCDDWAPTGASSSGTVGMTGGDQSWTNVESLRCLTSTAALLCFEQ